MKSGVEWCVDSRIAETTRAALTLSAGASFAQTSGGRGTSSEPGNAAGAPPKDITTSCTWL